MELSLRCNYTCCDDCGSACSTNPNGCVRGCGERCGRICGRVAAYGCLPTRCNHHCKLPMNVCCNVKCAVRECNEFPTHGLVDRQPRRCHKHMMPGDVLSKGDICIYPGCCVERFPGIEFCIIHVKREQYIPGLDLEGTSLKRCSIENCTLNAVYGFYNTGKLFCVFHSALDTNIYAIERNNIKCASCHRNATQYSDINVLKTNPYAAPDICVKCALESSVKIHDYENCAKCGCYTVMFIGSSCASCYVAGYNNQLINDNWDILMRPINKHFILKRSTTGEFVCTIRSRICKNGDRNVFAMPTKSHGLAANRYTKFILSADARTPIRNRYIRTKILSDSSDTLSIMNDNAPSQNADHVAAEEEFIRTFTNDIFKTFKYITIAKDVICVDSADNGVELTTLPQRCI